MEKKVQFSIIYYILVVLLLFALQYWFVSHQVPEIPYRDFKAYIRMEAVQEVAIGETKIVGRLKPLNEIKRQVPDTTTVYYKRLVQLFPKKYRNKPLSFRVVPLPDDQLISLLETHGVEYRGIVESRWLETILLYWVVPFVILFLIWGYLIRRMGTGSHVMTFGKSRAKIYAEDVRNKITFKDVAGIDEAVEEIKEVVEFLKNPQKYQRLGGKMPKGVLLVGPPGTGKTLLAKAVAGEAGVPFFSISGSEFVEMFVGVGAARVRDLFSQAKEKAPCIVFIDEIDAIGRSRGAGPMIGGHDERENTLNQLLVEMDGFDTSKGVVIMAATNRPDVLDPALLRPGRFDRQIVVDRPDLNGRVAIFKVHMRNLPLAEDVDVKLLAAQTPGFVGADIANVCNEAALLAARKNKEKISMEDFQEAIERVVAGLKKPNKVINEYERQVVAYHESGHALVGYFLPHGDFIAKVSIVPRGVSALGYTLQTPLEDRYLLTREELEDKIASLLGGRAAEAEVFGTISTGAANDLERATEIARNMVMQYGMSEKLANLSFISKPHSNFLGNAVPEKPMSEKTATIIDEEIQMIIQRCYQKAIAVIRENRDKLEALAQRLLQKEVVERNELEEILGRPITKKGIRKKQKENSDG